MSEQPFPIAREATGKWEDLGTDPETGKRLVYDEMGFFVSNWDDAKHFINEKGVGKQRKTPWWNVPIRPERTRQRNPNVQKEIGAAHHARYLLLTKEGKQRSMRERFQDIPENLRPLTAAWLDEAYVTKAFIEPWQSLYRLEFRKLKRHYSPEAADAPQYVLLCQRVAALATLIRWAEAEQSYKDFRLAWDRQLKEYIAQLQKYTEAEKRLQVVVSAAEMKVLEHAIAVAEFAITDKQILSEYLGALERAITSGAMGDDAAMHKLLAEPSSSNGVIDHIPDEVMSSE